MKLFKRITTIALSMMLLTGLFAVPTFAETEGTLIATFVYPHSGYSDYIRFPVGGVPTIPEAPYIEGYTFCGFDKSVVGIAGNDFHTYAVYVPNGDGDAAIQAKINSLPVPAISGTKAVDRSAGLVPMAVDPAALQAAAAAQAALQAALAQASALQTAALTGQTALASSPVIAVATNAKDLMKLVQTKLNEQGYDCGTPDGVLGSKTKAAIKKFQQDKGLSIDGVAGKMTRTALGL